MLAIGMMSGTSLDGIDACLVKITTQFSKESYEIVDFYTRSYTDEEKQKILNTSFLDSSNVQKVCSLNYELGLWHNQAIESLLLKANVSIREIEFIAIHGQTVWHNPNNLDGFMSSTLQLTEPAVISYYFNKLVISNFRAMDIASGGSGAPLIPFVHYELFKSKTNSYAIQNIGGIGNVTYLPKMATLDDIIAFDTGPGNMLIDGAMRKLFHLPYDESGKHALKGKINHEVLEFLLNDSYFNLPFPKSTGREKYNESLLDKIIAEVLKTGNFLDVITTISEFTVMSIVKSYRLLPTSVDNLVLCGGGSHNKYIFKRLSELLPQTKVEISNISDEIEAFGFAILGYKSLQKEPSNVKNVTGAKKNCILGSFTYAPFKE